MPVKGCTLLLITKRICCQAKKEIEILDCDSVKNLKLAVSSDETQCRFLYDTHISEQPMPRSSEYSLMYPRDTNISTFLRSLNPHLPNHTTTFTITTLLALTFPDQKGTHLEECSMRVPFAVDST